MKKYTLAALFLTALAIRILLIPNPGFEADIAFWKSWGLSALDNGIVKGITLTNNNYPTPFSYLLGLLAYCYRLFADPHSFNDYWNSGNTLFLLFAKLPSILADMGIAAIILWIGKHTKRLGFPHLSFSFYLVLAILYLFNPAVLIDGALWGQVDSVGVFVFLLAITAGCMGKPTVAGAIFMLSMMTKLQNMIYGPLFFLFLWQLGSYKWLVKSVIGATAAFFLLNIQFLLTHNMAIVIASITSNYDYFPWMSLNAFNLWWILAKGAGMQMSDKLLTIGIINAKTMGLILFSSGYLLAVITMIQETIKSMGKSSAIRNQPSDIFHKYTMGDTSEGFHDESSLGSKKYNHGQNILHFASELKRGMENASGRTHKELHYSTILFRFFTALTIVVFCFFLFQTQSHERYAFPATVFILFWGAFFVFQTNTEKMRMMWWKTKTFRIFIIGYIVFSILFSLNLHTALAYNYPQNSIPALLFLRSPAFTIPISVFQIAFFFFFLFLARNTINIRSFLFVICSLSAVILALNLPLIVKSPVSLTKLTPIVSKQDYGVRVTNMPVDAAGPSKNWKRLSVQYSFYRYGIGTHAKSRIVYDIAGHFKRFTTDMGIDTESGAKGSVIFTVYGDDKLLYTSDTVKRFEYPRHADLDVTDVKTLTLDVDGTEDGITDDHADWLNPILWP